MIKAVNITTLCYISGNIHISITFSLMNFVDTFQNMYFYYNYVINHYSLIIRYLKFIDGYYLLIINNR